MAATNDAGLTLAATEDGPCWSCDEPGGGVDRLCTGCTNDVLFVRDDRPLDRWDRRAATEGVPPIDRAKWREFYGDYYGGASPASTGGPGR